MKLIPVSYTHLDVYKRQELNCDIGDLVEIDTFNDKKVGEEKNGKR